MSFSRLFYRYYLLLLFPLLLPVMKSRIEVNLRSILWSDCEGYYMYLPGVFVLKDVHKIPPGSMWPVKNEQGEMVLKYTCGVALFEAPAFFAARAYCRQHGLNADDYFNEHFSRAIAYGGFTMAFWGLFFLHRALRRRYSEQVTFWVVLSVFLGTNLFHYATREPGMSHVYSFFLMAFAAWQTPRFLKRASWGNAALLGAALGWLVLIRPTNAVALLFVYAYDVYSWAELKTRTAFFFREHWKKTLLAAATGFVFFIPQMLYWHEMTGKWVRYSYEGEGFIYWAKPKIAAVLFDVQNGLFTYSPMALLMLAGIVTGWRARKHQAFSTAFIFVLSTYLFASWWAWWFGGAFGHRSYVELYALLAFPLAGLYEKIFALRRLILRDLALAGLIFLMFYSVRLSFLYTKLPGPWDGPDWRWNWEKLAWVWSYLFKF